MQTQTMEKVQLGLEYIKRANPAILQQGTHILTTCVLKNNDDKDIRDLEVTITGDLVLERREAVSVLPAHESVSTGKLDIVFDRQKTDLISEAADTSFVVTVKTSDNELIRKTFPVRLLPRDYWPGIFVHPETLAVFITPNVPAVAHVLQNAGRWMERMTGNSALDEYQTHDINRVRHQVAAIYEALREEGIVYATPPASFEKEGQRVRTAETVVKDKLGTCLDLSLLYASCLEQCGLNPIVVITNDHAFVGCWLEETFCALSTSDDASLLSKSAANGVGRLVVVETTLVASSEPVTFDQAVAEAERLLTAPGLVFVDIHRCRLDNIRPLSQKNDSEWENEGVRHGNGTRDISEIQKIDIAPADASPLTREQIWERKLLDISLRNNLINLKLGKKTIPFISYDIEKIEDFLQDGRDYHILPNPQDLNMQPNSHGMFDSREYKDQYETSVTGKRKNGWLTSYLRKSELADSLKFFYRESRNALEENGANTLFLALGILRWYETEKSQQPRYAPILLLPVDIIRKSNTDYVIRTRDEDITFNTALGEMLKQNFHVSISGLTPLPEDGHGCDVLKVLTIIRHHIMNLPRWDVLEESILGLFSFSKFVMWNDVHSNIDLMRKNPVIDALLNKGSWAGDEKPVDVSGYDDEYAPSDNAIPIDVDSSQLEAVLESGQGHSFILYGPPGTGKSQTITNMIANALFHGKRVLFVAEKMAALEVVQRRLEKIGLAPFCLELHSNKVTKSHFLEQLDKALSLTRIKEPEQYARTADDLLHERQKLSHFNKLMHEDAGNGMSLCDCITRYSSIEGGIIRPSDGFMRDFTPRKLAMAIDQIKEAGKLIGIIGKPCHNPLYGLKVTDSSQQTISTLKQQLPLLSSEIEGVESAIRDVSEALFISLPRDFSSIPFVYALQNILSQWDEAVLFENAEELSAAWQEASGKWFIPRYFGQKQILARLRQYNSKVAKDNVTEFLQTLSGFHNKAMELNISLFSGQPVSFDKGRITNNTKGILAVRNIKGTCDTLQEACSFQGDFESISKLIPNWLGNLDKVRDWALWCSEMESLRQADMESVIPILENATADDISSVADAFAKGCYACYAQGVIDSHRELQLFKGLLFEERIKKYKALDAKFKSLTKKMLYYRLASKVPSQVTGVSDASELGILKRYIHSKGRGSSIRTIIDQIPELLPRLSPVMLMSPISVAQFLDLHNQKFDIVCFDEASQMPTPEAVGAIARGNALICVGDPKQMPPTSFFSSNATDDEDAENDDMESILEDCITISLPGRHLNWHYRSKHESLIAFSNQQYYDGKLYTFPSVDDKARRVKYVHVNGSYDYGKTRCNRAEAEAIVAEVVKRLQSPSDESIGIVAFSKVQQNLIEDILGDTLASHPELEKKAFDGDEPIFVKNLENVQGDERDVILFSVGYGPDKNGKVSMNFGPLNNIGGERRLNVAVSRARSEMMVFTIMEPEMIDLKRTNAQGVVGLKNFLKFAKTGELPLRNGQVNTVGRDIADVIGDAITRRGYKVDTHVGRSAFKIDIAVIDKRDPEKYILGILCDGNNFFNAKTEREREIGQPSFLRHMGWNLLRVWSLDWYMDKSQVMARILSTVKACETSTETSAEVRDNKSGAG